MMLTTIVPPSEESCVSEQPASNTLAELIHDLRQPLSTIDACAYCLSLILPQTEGAARRHVEMIAQQVEEASRILALAVAAKESRSTAAADDLTLVS